MNFLLFGILGYTLNGLAMIIDKILIKSSLPDPLVYVFFINITGWLFLLLTPFGVIFSPEGFWLGTISGIFFVVALVCTFYSLKTTDLTVATPVIGSLHPLFSLIIGSLFLGQMISNFQLLAFFVLILGAVILTYSLWSKNLGLNKSLYLMVAAGLFFGISSVLVKESFEASNFISGFTFSRISAAVLVTGFLLVPKVRADIFSSKVAAKGFINKTSLLLIFGQGMGAFAGILLTVAVFFEQPALVNALFGVQYVVILLAAVFLSKKYPQLLSEHLSRGVLGQKILGAIVLSVGVYLLSL